MGERNASRIILMMGAPGSGKGTQSSLLSRRLGIPHVSTGALLREEARRNTPAGFRLRQTLAGGALVDDGMVFEAVAARLSNLPRGRAGLSGLILDGFPRTVAQARMLDDRLTDLGLPAPLVFHLEVPESALLARLACRRQCATCGAIYNLRSGRSVNGSRCQLDGGALIERDDDSAGVVGQRLAAYERETLPVLDYYRQHRRAAYLRLDGDREPAEIAKDFSGMSVFLDDTAVAA